MDGCTVRVKADKTRVRFKQPICHILAKLRLADSNGRKERLARITLTNKAVTPMRDLRKLLLGVLGAIITAGILGTAGTLYAYGNRLSVVEENLKFFKDTITEIRYDLKEIKEDVKHVRRQRRE
jgi:hypothetical protein